MRARVSTAGLLGALLVLTACGSDDDSGGNQADGELEATDVTVGVLPLADYAAVYWADENGFFEAEGLEVSLEPLQGGPVGIQSAATGEVDFSFANTISTVLAQSAGQPVEIVALSSAIGDGSQLYVVQPDSPLQSIEDLDGVTVGVNTTNNIGDIPFRALADQEGVDVEPNFVEVPFPEMIAGVQAGSIEVGYLPEPFASAALAAGLRPVVDLTDGPANGLAAASFVSGSDFIDDNPDTVAAFARAIYAAGADISANEADFRAWLPTIAQVDESIAQSMKLPTFFGEPDAEALQQVVDLVDGDAYDLDAYFFQP